MLMPALLTSRSTEPKASERAVDGGGLVLRVIGLARDRLRVFRPT